MRHNLLIAALSVCAAISTGAATTRAAHPLPSDAYPTTFGEPRVDLLPDGKVVINLDTAGELKGLLTLNLAPNEAGVMTGEWVLAVRYVDNTDPATGVEPEPHSHDADPETLEAEAAAAGSHRDYVRFVDKGVIGGTVSAAALELDADGALIDFRAALNISVGTLTFAGATGTGLVEKSRGLALAF